MNTNVELKNHIICEFARHCDMRQNIFESHGYISGIDEVVDAFAREVEPIIRNVIERKRKSGIKLNDPSILNGVKSFFKEFVIKILFVPADNEWSSSNGSTDSTGSVRKDKMGNIVSCPNITLKIQCGNDLNSAINSFTTILSHELTHAWNIYRYVEEHGTESLLNNLTKTQRYGKFVSPDSAASSNRKALTNILYTLNRMERNAYVAEVRRELYDNRDKITDAKSGFDVVKNTSSYRNRFKMLEANVKALLFDIKAPSVKKEIIDSVNDIMGKKFTNYEQAKKYLVRRWVRWKEKYMTSVSKMVYDICNENTIMMDNGFVGKNGNIHILKDF